MKWKNFKNKFPLLGSNIIVRNKEYIGLCEFNLEHRRSIKYLIENNACDGNSPAECITWFTDDPEQDGCYCIDSAIEWVYPSELLNNKNEN